MLTSNLDQLEQLAIKAAISQNWQEAINYNQIIISKEPTNIPALNRLGIAQIKTNHPTLAKNSFQLVLKINPHNSIAKNNLSQIKTRTTTTSTKTLDKNTAFITSFIEEPGKSKVIPLTKIAEPQVIHSLIVGQKVDIKISKHKICIIDPHKRFLGYLPDNISNHILHLAKSGYHYDVFIKSINPKSFAVFMQEIKQSKKLKGTPSFPVNGEIFPKLDAGEPNAPPLEIFDPLIEDSETY